MGRDPIDLHAVEARHEAIHARLLNWARWCQPRHYSAVQPMFRYYTPYLVPREPRGTNPIDILDATALQKSYRLLPFKHRECLKWFYVTGGSPKRARQALGVSTMGLCEMVRNARIMLINVSGQRGA